MNKHEEARNDLYLLDITCDMVVFEEKRKNIDNYITSCEATENQLSTCKIERSLNEKMYQELQKDVKRFMEIFNINDDSKLWQEHNELVDKLSKVGNE